MAETLYNLPSSFRAGTTVSYTRTLSDYPASAGWVLNLYLNSLTSATSAQAAASGDSHVVTLSATATGALAAGDYTWGETVTLSGVVYEVASGTVRVLPKLASAAAGSIQTENEKLLAEVETALHALAVNPYQAYSIGIRSYTFQDLDKLKKWRGELVAKVHAERNPGNPFGYVSVVFPEVS